MILLDCLSQYLGHSWKWKLLYRWISLTQTLINVHSYILILSHVKYTPSNPIASLYSYCFRSHEVLLIVFPLLGDLLQLLKLVLHHVHCALQPHHLVPEALAALQARLGLLRQSAVGSHGWPCGVLGALRARGTAGPRVRPLSAWPHLVGGRNGD